MRAFPNYISEIFIFMKKTPSQKKHAIAHIQSTLTNTIITITDLQGNTKTWSSSGNAGFQGSRRSTNYAAQATADHVARVALQLGVKSVEARLRGLSYGKESALRGLLTGGLIITKISDVTPIAHNGCRPKKKRRI
jgi:small subunit ribosomal protein S11